MATPTNSTIGAAFVPPASGDLAGELSAIAGLTSSLRDNISAGIQLELDAAAQTVDQMAAAYQAYIDETLGQAAVVYDLVRQLHVAYLDGNLGGVNDLLAQIESIIEPAAEPLTPDTVNAMIGGAASVAPSAGGSVLADAPPASNFPSPAATALAGTDCYNLPDYPGPAPVDLAAIGNPVVIPAGGGAPVAADHFDASWFTPKCEHGFFYSLEPTPLSIASIALATGGDLFMNRLTGWIQDPRVSLAGWDGLTLADTTPIDPDAAYQMFLTEYNPPSVDRFIRQCGLEPPAGIAPVCGNASSPATVQSGGGSISYAPPAGGGTCQAYVESPDVPAFNAVLIDLVCEGFDGVSYTLRGQAGQFPALECTAIVAADGSIVRASVQTANVGAALSSVQFGPAPAESMTPFLFRATGVIYGQDVGPAGTASVVIAGDNCFAACQPSAPPAGISPAAPPAAIPVAPPAAPAPAGGACPPPVIQVNCSQCGRPAGGTGDDDEFVNELEWLMDTESNSAYTAFSAAFGGAAAAVMQSRTVNDLLRQQQRLYKAL